MIGANRDQQVAHIGPARVGHHAPGDLSATGRGGVIGQIPQRLIFNVEPLGHIAPLAQTLHFGFQQRVFGPQIENGPQVFGKLRGTRNRAAENIHDRSKEIDRYDP